MISLPDLLTRAIADLQECGAEFEALQQKIGWPDDMNDPEFEG